MIVESSSGVVRLAANLKWMFTEVPFVERFAAAAEAGFTAVEFASPYELAPAEVRRLLDDAGLAQILINTPAGPAGSPTASGAAYVPGARQEFRDGVLRALEYAGALDARVVHVMAGIRPAEVDADLAFATYVSNISWAAEQARGTGVRLALEAINKRDQPGYGLASMETAAAVAQAVDPEVVGVLFDVYHAQVDRGNVIERFERLHPLIAHVQIADNPGRGEPGTGEIAYERVLARIARSGYAGWIGCEYAPVAGTRDGLSWLERIIR
ncbi:hydroxypyruvate isomerase family protein [Microbacterium sp. W4I20]|uniref:hydroxypyruvate isomerase family protein n=1 Tax=Microbacterium sp. W4I20 TaxID=3042262 RepID=UPI0027807026|nr:TIM barrel protein [Microbacterium sp. W4I20]MDQ0727632.1 hydroxypyruvate isomerase [Microbacterium sp. W4I20]